MIRTKEYIIVKKYGNKWVPAKEYGCIEPYSLRNAMEVLEDMRNGEIEGHSKNGEYKIMEICYCDIVPKIKE